MPYNRFALPKLYEATLVHALRRRGAEVDYVMCDGMFSECDLWMPANGIERPANSCGSCQAETASFAADLGIDFTWLGRFLTREEGREAAFWARSLEAEDLLSATHGQWPVGEWVRSSVQSHFRTSHLDPTDPAIEPTLRGYVRSALIAAFALDRMLAETTPDVMVVFNGRMSSTRVALELAQARGVRVVSHERGFRDGTWMLIPDAYCMTLQPYHRYWEDWGGVALTADQLYEIGRLMSEREHGRNTGWVPFTPAPQPSADVLRQLRLSGERPIWVLFTSSDDEVANEEDYRSPFGSQHEWITQTIEHARRNPDIDLVIRVHPNTGSKRSWGANRVQLQQMSELAQDLPPNVRMVAPDVEISSYSLMDLCTLGLVWVSTAGIELAVKGKHVVVAAGNYISQTSFAHTVRDAAAYGAQLDCLHELEPGAVDAEIRRLALRQAHGVFFGISLQFPLVAATGVNEATLAWSSPDQLAAGRDEMLDRWIRIIVDGEPVVLAPTAEDRARDTEAENAFLDGFGEQRLHVLALADELIADDELLVAFAAAFADREDVTLLIQTLEHETAGLVQAVGRARLDGDGGPALVAGELDPDVMAAVEAVYSRRRHIGPLGEIPHHTPESLAELASATLASVA